MSPCQAPVRRASYNNIAEPTMTAPTQSHQRGPVRPLAVPVQIGGLSMERPPNSNLLSSYHIIGQGLCRPR